jgi:tetratricopeptide (TPR) repeat protein
MTLMKKPPLIIAALAGCALVAAGVWYSQRTLRAKAAEAEDGVERTPPGAVFTGSRECRKCHEHFYQLWATSFHGLAMQPYTPEFARSNLTVQAQDVVVRSNRFRAVLGPEGGAVRESGPKGDASYPIVHVMGGKNVYYFLTPLERGRLQVLPVAYDVRRREWFDTAASAMRHFTEARDEALDWRDPLYTFNTSCHGCHVSQLALNYTPGSDAYHTTWVEPGINCETCHGPASEHVRAAEALPKGRPMKDVKLITARQLSKEQMNHLCAPCHAKMSPITQSFAPGERYYDHYDLVSYENADFHADGRDLGENYTYTSWQTSPCVRSGQLDCTHCHTSSGRYRFADERLANQACLPCHKQQADNLTAHTHHQADSAGSRCIACHMPMTEFARMRRSDHSMLPPTPAATLAFKSPNACNLCHADKDAAWADRYVREWHQRDYQAPVLRRGALVAAARRGDWSRLPEMLADIAGKDRDEIHAASLVRLLLPCNDARKWPALIGALKDPSPLVRAAAATGLADRPTPDAVAALVAATRDDYRLVRVRAATSLASYPIQQVGEDDRQHVEKAFSELEASLLSRPDDWASHYNLGGYFVDRGRLPEALKHFETASKLRADVVPPLVNASLVYARLGRNAEAEAALRKAVKLEPANGAANFNLGLLLAEQNNATEAEQCLRAAIKADPNLAAAAYNLGILLARDRIDEAVRWCRRAAELRPDEPRYAYTLAFYLRQRGDSDQARQVLERSLDRAPAADACFLLGEILERRGDVAKARAVYQRALALQDLPPQERRQLEAKLRSLSAP